MRSGKTHYIPDILEKRNEKMGTELKGVSNALAVFGAYGISLAEFTGAVDLPLWVGVISALAGTGLTITLIMIRYAEYRKTIAEAHRLEMENEKYEHDENTNTDADSHTKTNRKRKEH